MGLAPPQAAADGRSLRLIHDNATEKFSKIPTGLVPLEGLEPPRPCEQQILSLSRLPFRHRGQPWLRLIARPCAVNWKGA